MSARVAHRRARPTHGNGYSFSDIRASEPLLSAKHIGLYGRFGFYPRFLTAIMTKPATATCATRWTRYSEIPAHERAQYLDAAAR